MAAIIEKKDPARLAGFRKKGGIYLVGTDIFNPEQCCKLMWPIITHCDHCGGGIRQARGFTWIDKSMFKKKKCDGSCASCPLCTDYIKRKKKGEKQNNQIGLMWIGLKHYKSAEIFINESSKKGICLSLNRIPFDLVIGETWIALAHPKAIIDPIDDGPLNTSPGIFQLFRPSDIEYVVTGNESEKKLLGLKKRGFTLVKVTESLKQPVIF